jgi:hypothetical protein
VSRKKPWLDRDASLLEAMKHAGTRGVDHKAELNSRLRLLISRKMCPEQAIAWLKTEQREERRKRYVLSDNANARVGKHPAIALSGLQHLHDGALLTFAVLVEKTSQLVNYAVGLQGRGRETDSPWYARIDLTEKPEGEGPCGHPLLHCHVGADPSNKGEPETRVPLPFLMPAEALDWLLATADPALEPTDSD